MTQLLKANDVIDKTLKFKSFACKVNTTLKEQEELLLERAGRAFAVTVQRLLTIFSAKQKFCLSRFCEDYKLLEH